MPDETEGTRTLLGDQRSGIAALAVPIGVALFFQQLNNIADSAWVAGLGGDALAALGIVYPIYSILIGIGNGLGIGVSAAIARSVGERDRGKACRAAGQGITLSILVGIVLTIVLLATAEPSMGLMGAGDMAEDCLAYAYPIYISTVFIVLSGVISGMLRGEGMAKRSMAVQVTGAMVNIVLDPILIYVLDMGVAGAAWATAAAFAVSVAMAAYWYSTDGEMYVRLSSRDLRYDGAACRDILSVGLPESLELSIMYLFNIYLNFVVIQVGGTDAVGIYATGWRFASFILIVAQAMGGAMTAVCAAEYGMRRFDMIGDAFRYTVTRAFAWTVALSAVLTLCSGALAVFFTMEDGIAYMRGDARAMFLFFSAFLPVMSLVYTGSSLLQAIDRATGAMLNTLARNLLFCLLFWLASVHSGTLTSLWWGMLAAEVAGGVAMALHARIMLRRAEREDGGAPAGSRRHACARSVSWKGVRRRGIDRLRLHSYVMRHHRLRALGRHR